MFLKLVFDNRIKKLAFHDDLKNLASIRDLIRTFNSYKDDEFDMKLKDSSDNMHNLDNDEQLQNLHRYIGNDKFVVIEVIKRPTIKEAMAVPNETEFIDLSGNKSYEAKLMDDMANFHQDLAKNDNFNDDFIVGCFDVEDMILCDINSKTEEEPRINLENKNNDLCPKLNRNKVDTKKSKSKSIKRTVACSRSKGKKRCHIVDVEEKDVDQEAEKTKMLVSEPKKESKFAMKFIYIHDKIAESEKKTAELINNRFTTLEDRITELSKLLKLQSSGEQPVIQNARSEQRCKTIRYGAKCDGCGMDPIVGRRFKCMTCSNFDLCESCDNMCIHNHPMVRLMSNNNPNIIQKALNKDSILTEQNEETTELNIGKKTEENTQNVHQYTHSKDDNYIDEQVKLKMEFLDFMFSYTLSQEAKEKLVKQYECLELSEFCAVANTFEV